MPFFCHKIPSQTRKTRKSCLIYFQCKIKFKEKTTSKGINFSDTKFEFFKIWSFAEPNDVLQMALHDVVPDVKSECCITNVLLDG